MIYVYEKELVDCSWFSERDKAAARGDVALRSFFEHWRDSFSVAELANRKRHSYSEEIRSTLVEVLKEQYQGIEQSENVVDNIQKLKNGAMCVTTAHQLNIFSGPLYIPLKIADTIALAKQWTSELNEDVVPVFWLGGEDHDFEEINHTFLFGKKIEWQLEHTGEVTGKLSTDTIQDSVQEYCNLLGDSSDEQALKAAIKSAYSQGKTLAQAARLFLHFLFGEHGLIILDANDKRLKQYAKSIFAADVKYQSSFQFVNQTILQLEANGFEGQASARPINFFYIDEKQIRHRVDQVDARFETSDKILSWTKNELLLEIEKSPERFSPNVILRPIYQETILPNLAYIGGPGEISYWMERRSQFDHFKLPMPLVLRRTSAVVIEPAAKKKMLQVGLTVEGSSKQIYDVQKLYVKQNSKQELSLEAELKQLEAVYKQIQEKATSINPGLARAAESQLAAAQKQLINLEKKLIKEEKQKHEVDLQRIAFVKDKLFPDGKPMERSTNIGQCISVYGFSFLGKLIEHCNPLAAKVCIFAPEFDNQDFVYETHSFITPPT